MVTNDYVAVAVKQGAIKETSAEQPKIRIKS